MDERVRGVRGVRGVSGVSELGELEELGKGKSKVQSRKTELSGVK